MKPYKLGKIRERSWSKILLFVGIAGLLVAIAGFFGLKNVYERNLRAVNPSAQEDITFVVESGDAVPQIAEGLKEKDLIRSARTFTQYVRSRELGESLKAGTYSLKQSFDVPTIVNFMVEGRVDTKLFTILPGKTLSQIKARFIEEGYDEALVSTALEPGQYKDHPALVDKPKKASLEGYLYPDSYQKIAETTPQTIIRQSLDEMAEALSPDVRAGIAKQGLSVFEGITLASIVEREVGERDKNGRLTGNRPKAAQVFLKRLDMDMKLQSNATDDFPDNYDTYSITGLPPGPISNVTISSLEAVVNPAKSEYLFFVAGKDCVTRFSETEEQHENLKARHGIASEVDKCRG